MLRLFAENVESELERKDNHTWTPAQRQYVPYFPNTSTNWWMCAYRDVSPTSQFRVVFRKKIGHSIWASYREASEVINLAVLFSKYWSSNDHEFTLMSQSSLPTSPRMASHRTTVDVVNGKHSFSIEVQFSANNTVRTFTTAHPAT